jgi:hypothetical protein
MGVHRNRLTQVAAAAVALVLVAVASAAKPTPPTLSHARVCALTFFGAGLWDYRRGECYHDERAKLEPASQYACSVRYRAPRRTRLVARLLYEDRLQRTQTTSVSGSGTGRIGIGFAALKEQNSDELESALPGGRYRCDFSLGNRRIAIRFRSPGPMLPVLAASSCPTSTTLEGACDYFEGAQPFHPPSHSITCSAIFARLQGHSVEIQFLREGVLIYAARDRLDYPITSHWAHTSAGRGQTLPAGDYVCRFLLDGASVAEKRFSLLSY